MGFSPDRLRGHRHGQKLRMATLARLAEMEPLRLHAIETGAAGPSFAEEDRLVRALGVLPTDLDATRLTPSQNYLAAVLTYARDLTEDEIETAASTIRQIRAAS